MQEKLVIRSRMSHGIVDLTPLCSTALGMDDLEIACTWTGTWANHGLGMDASGMLRTWNIGILLRQ